MIRNVDQAIALRDALRVQRQVDAENFVKQSGTVEASEVNTILMTIDAQIRKHPNVSELVHNDVIIPGISHSTICDTLEDLGFKVNVVINGNQTTTTISW